MDLQSEQALNLELIYERWKRGRLGYKLHDGQKLIVDTIKACKRQLFVGECARQFGKTFLEVLWALEVALRIPKARVKIGTAFSTDLVEFIIPAFDAVIQDCPLPFRPVYKSQKQKYVLSNGSEIKLIGLDRKPNGLRGNVPDLIILDEAAFCSNLLYLYRSVLIPATTHRPDCRILVFSTPPSTPAHEFLDLVAKAKIEEGHCKFTIYQNPMVSPATIERLKQESGGEDSSTWKREYLCLHVTDENLTIIPEWKPTSVQDIPHDAYYRYYHKYIAMDLGVIDHTAILFGYYDFLKASIIIEDEWFENGPKITTSRIRQAIDHKKQSLWGTLPVYRKISDNNNPLLLNDLSTMGENFFGTDKGSLEEMVNKVREMAKNGRIIVHPRCKYLSGCLEFGVWKKNRRDFERTDTFGHFDALAALVYLVRNLNESTNPIPNTFGVDEDNQVIIPNRMNDPAKQIRKAFS